MPKRETKIFIFCLIFCLQEIQETDVNKKKGNRELYIFFFIEGKFDETLQLHVLF